MNCIIAQSGGPTSVINSSVVGLVEANFEHKFFNNVYAGINGIEGILNENIINLSKLTNEELDLFKHTPSSGLGSCRYKLKDFNINDSEYKSLLKILHKFDITTFFYIGGNDSMDTTAKLNEYAIKNNIAINFIGIPKTIDNDLIYTDHTPGFGSAAKFIATSALETYLDSTVYINNGIFILETMGRDTGWLAASASLASLNGKSVVDFIYLPETIFDEKKFIQDVKLKFNNQNHVFIVVSEGIKNKDGLFLGETLASKEHDIFGHTKLGGVSSYLKDIIIKNNITPKVKILELGVLQRCALHCSSKIDFEEASMVGKEALKCAMKGLTGYMVAIRRDTESPYTSTTFLVKANKIANKIKYFPTNWINKEGNNITNEAINYLKPLICDSPKLSFENNLPKYKVYGR